MKGKLGIEKDILVKRVHCTKKILRNGGKRIKKKTIVGKSVNFNDKSGIINTYREKKSYGRKNLCKRGFFGGNSQHWIVDCYRKQKILDPKRLCMIN